MTRTERIAQCQDAMAKMQRQSMVVGVGWMWEHGVRTEQGVASEDNHGWRRRAQRTRSLLTKEESAKRNSVVAALIISLLSSPDFPLLSQSHVSRLLTTLAFSLASSSQQRKVGRDLLC